MSDLSVGFCQLCMVIIVGVSNVGEDSFIDDTAESVARYIIDQLVTSVTAPAGMCRCVQLFSLYMCRCLMCRINPFHCIIGYLLLVMLLTSLK